MARKNGKTALIACMVLVHLIGPEWVENGEIYSAANDREQAGQIYKFAAQIVRATPALARKLRCVDSTKTIACYSNGSFYRALSADSGNKHGLNPTFVVFDELAQARSRELYDVLDTSFAARLEPLFVVISTQSNDPEHILSKLIDDGLQAADPAIVCDLYAVPEDADDIFDPEIWRKANPALGDFRSLADLKSLAAQAERLSSKEPTFRNLYLNQRVSPHSSMISRAEWMACVGDAALVQGEAVFAGLDLSAVVDLTSLVVVSASERVRVQSFSWKPGDLLEEHSNRDFGNKSARYTQWHKAGHLLVTPGRSIDPGAIARKVAELSSEYNIIGLAYDRWRIEHLFREFEQIGFPVWIDNKTEGSTRSRGGSGLRLVPWGQGMRDMAPAVDALELEITERRLVHDSNPVMNWAMGNAIVKSDEGGNRKIDKAKVKFRVDPAVALVMALGLRARDREQTALVPLIG